MGLASLIQYPWPIALATLVIVFLVAARLLGAFRTERVEAKTGIVLLCAMRWNEYSRLISEVLKDRGLQAAGADRTPGQDGFDLLFARGTARYLVQCRNGANQTVTPAAVGQLHSLVQVQDADGAIIVSCADADPAATKLARERRIEILAGSELWAHVKPWVAHDQRVDAESVAQVAKRQRLLSAALIALLAAIAAFTIISLRAPTPDSSTPPEAVAPTQAAPARPITPQPAAGTPALPDANLTEQQLASRRASTVLEVRDLTPVASASWSARSTLQITLREAPDDATLATVVDDICRSLLQYEELRYTRLQIDVPGSTPEQPVQVRWRQCR
jgi:hypothetical protein